MPGRRPWCSAPSPRSRRPFHQRVVARGAPGGPDHPVHAGRRPLPGRRRGRHRRRLRRPAVPRRGLRPAAVADRTGRCRCRRPAPSPVGAWAIADPDGKLATAVAKRLGAPLASAPVSRRPRRHRGRRRAARPRPRVRRHRVGARPASSAIIGYGGGRATAVVVDAVRAVPGCAVTVDRLGAGRRVSYAEALRARGQLEPMDDPIQMGLPPGGAAFVRGNPEMLGLFGARCRDLRDDLDPAVDPPHLHRMRWRRARGGLAGAPGTRRRPSW